MASFKSILKAGFPFIAAGLGLTGPIGAAASSALAGVLGVNKPNPSADDLDSAFANIAPDQLPTVIQNLKAADQQFQVTMKQMGYADAESLAKIDADDRASARNLEIQSKDHTAEHGFYLITAGFFLTLWWVFVRGVAPSVHDLAMTMVGVLGTAWTGSCAYYYGSSRGSDSKNAIIENLSK